MEEEIAGHSVFVLRVWRDDDGRLWGRLNKPISGWRQPFNGLDQLCALLLEQVETTRSPAGRNTSGQRE